MTVPLACSLTRSFWMRIGLLVVLVLFAVASGTPASAQEVPDAPNAPNAPNAPAPHPHASPADSSCRDVASLRTVAPFRLTFNTPAQVRVRGLHVQVRETIGLNEQPCYVVQGLEVG